MSINLDFKKVKVNASYKTVYLKDDIVDKINDIAEKEDTSFNSVVVRVLEYCIKNKIGF